MIEYGYIRKTVTCTINFAQKKGQVFGTNMGSRQKPTAYLL